MFSRLLRRILFPHTQVRRVGPKRGHIEGVEQLWHITPEGHHVEAWFLPAPQSLAPAVIFCHGNAELIDDWPHALAPYHRLGFHLLLPEYRGYGRSEGTPSEQAIRADLRAFYIRLAERPDVDPSSIVFHGRSLGGGAVCALAQHHHPAALILQSTFTSVTDIARAMVPFLPRRLVADAFDNRALLASLPTTVPVLIHHGTRDRVIPISHAEALHQAAPHSTLVTCGRGHNDCPPNWDAITALLE